MQLNASPPVRGRGVTLLAAPLIVSLLAQWAFVPALSYLTILEPTFTASGSGGGDQHHPSRLP